MHTFHILWSGPGSRKGHKPRFSLTESGLCETLHPDFGEQAFHALR
jgi:hypothetical protein